MKQEFVLIHSIVKLVVLISVCSLLVMSCASKSRESAVQEPVLSSKTNMSKTYQYGWNVSIAINNPGTRSEGRTFSLYYKKMPIPYVFESMYAGGQNFRFKHRVNLWDSAGYVPVDEPMIEFSQEAVSQAELKQGWYYSKFWKKSTPKHWCAVTREAISAVINPDKLEAFLSQYGWQPFSILKSELLPEHP